VTGTAGTTGHTWGAGPTGDGLVMVIPTYNEADNLPVILGRLHAALPDAHVLVVDDGSPDGTGEIAEAIAAQDARVRVVHRRTKEGLGAAYREGFEVALRAGYDAIGEMDADGSHQPEELPRLVAALERADVVIGSRWVPGGSIVNWPRRRELLSRAANTYARVLLGAEVRDLTAGFRLYRREALERIHLDRVSSHGYVFQTELAWRAIRSGLRVVEVPIEFVERVHGESKMDGAVAWESLTMITRWGVAERSRRWRRRTTRNHTSPAGR
jgi:dolichol-phosphate mannosyltransferase